MVIAAVEPRDDIIHIGEGAVGKIPFESRDLGIVAAIVAAAADAAADVVIDIGDVYPGFSVVEIGVDGKAHEAALRPGGDAGGRKVFVAVHVQHHPAPFVTGMDLVDLIVVRGRDPKRVIGAIDDLPGRIHARGTGGRIEGVDLKGLRIVGQRLLRRQVQSCAQARQEKQANASALHRIWIGGKLV